MLIEQSEAPSLLTVPHPVGHASTIAQSRDVNKHASKHVFRLLFCTDKLMQHSLLQISDAVKITLQQNDVGIILGGDHSMTIGTFHADNQVHEKPCLIWVDAHTDINTVLTSASGHIHGMPVSFLLKETASRMKQLPGFEWCQPR